MEVITVLGSPKTAWLGPRVQHSIIEEPQAAKIIEEYMEEVPVGARLYPFSYQQCYGRWWKIAAYLGVELFKPGSLRGGGTVSLWRRTDNLPLVLWKGCWLNEVTLKHYLQEAMAPGAESKLASGAKKRVQELDHLCDGIFPL